MGCASLFVVAGLAWPALHFLGGNTEPEALLIPVVIGGPAFVVAHILALVALGSRDPVTAYRGGNALRIMWGGVAIVLCLLLVAGLVELVRSRL